MHLLLESCLFKHIFLSIKTIKIKKLITIALQPALLTFLFCVFTQNIGNQSFEITAWMLFTALMIVYYIAMYGFNLLGTKAFEWRIGSFTITQLVFMMIFIGPFHNDYLIVSCLVVYGLAQYMESKNIIPTETLMNSKDKIIGMLQKVRAEELELERKLITRFNNLL